MKSLFHAPRNQTVYLGSDSGQSRRIQNALAHAGIDYKLKTRSSSDRYTAPGQGTLRSLGNAGVQWSAETSYEICVAKDDLDQAAALINALPR